MELIIEDDKAAPGEAQKTIMKLTNVDNVDFLIVGTTATVPVAGSIVQDKIIFTPSLMPEASDNNNNVYSMLPSSASEMESLAKYIYATGLRNISIIYVNNDLGLTSKNNFQKAFTKLGGNILSIETFGLTDTDYRTQLSKIKNTASPGILAIMSGGGLGNILIQAKELGINAKFFGQTVTESPVFIQVAGNLSEGMIYAYPFRLSELEDSFVQKYKARYNESPEMYATASYFIIYTIAELAKNCGDHCETKDLSNFQLTVAGKDIQFDKDRALITPIYIKTVRDGKFVFLE